MLIQSHIAHRVALAVLLLLLLLLCASHNTPVLLVSAVRLPAFRNRDHHYRTAAAAVAEDNPPLPDYYDHYDDHHHYSRDTNREDIDDEEEDDDDDDDRRPRLRRLSSHLSASLKGLAFDLLGFGFDVNERDDEGRVMTVTDDDNDDDNNAMISASLLPPATTIEPSISPDVSIEPSISPDVSIEPYPSPLFSSSSSSSSNGKQPRAATSTTTTSSDYPCQAGYALRKQYTVFPRYVYLCQKAHRVDARKTTARCPDGFFRRFDLCIRSVTLCAFRPMADPSCTIGACDEAVTTGGEKEEEAEFRLIESVASCLICPSGYLLYFDEGVGGGMYRCYKMLVETPVCVGSGKVFNSGVGKCL